MIDNLTPALWRLCRTADQGDPYAVALRDYIARLCDAAGERRPPALGLPCQGVQYTIDKVEFWDERVE